MYTFVYRAFIKFILFCRGQALDVFVYSFLLLCFINSFFGTFEKTQLQIEHSLEHLAKWHCWMKHEHLAKWHCFFSFLLPPSGHSVFPYLYPNQNRPAKIPYQSSSSVGMAYLQLPFFL